MCDNTIKTVERMLAVATPIIALNSYDHPHTLGRLVASLDAKERPVIAWNIADGFVAQNGAGKKALEKLDPNELKAAQQGGPHAALQVSLKFVAGAVLVMQNLHWFWDKPQVTQTLLNVREPFKGSRRCVIGLILDAKLPTDLIQSVSFVDDPLPSEELLAEKVQGVCRSVLTSELAGDEATAIARELRGTSPFRAEQLAAQSLTRDGIDRARLRDNARKQINDTPGLSVESGNEKFDDIGGLNAMREYLTRYFNGPRRPLVVVRIEEIEKALAGVGTESSGTSGDALGVLLTAMEDYRWTGILAYGVSGCGKSLVAKATANEFGAKAIKFDLNACKGSLVGESEKKIRNTTDVLHAIGGDRVFIIASMNKIESLPPELRRRFAAGTWYFDVPDKAARHDIWHITAKQFGVTYDGYDAEMLTGSDIRDIVQRSYELGCTTTEAARYHVPLCRSAPDAISKSRNDAAGRYLDANVGGPYRDPTNVATTYDRSIEV